MSIFNKYAYWWLIATVSLVLYALFAFSAPHLPLRYVSDKVGYIILFFAILTGSLHLLINKLAGQRPQRFVTYYMGLTTLKMFVLVIVLMAFALTHRIEAASFILTFFVCYLVFSVFDVVMMLKGMQK